MASLENVSLEEMESLANITKTLADNPSTRRRMLQLIKEASPMTNIPEIDLEHRLELQNKPLTDKISELESSLQMRDFNEMRKENHKKLIEMGVSKDNIKDVEQTMIDRKIGDYEVAGQFYMSQNQPAEPTAGTFGSPLKMPNMKEMGDINVWARGQAYEAVNDIIKARR